MKTKFDYYKDLLNNGFEIYSREDVEKYATKDNGDLDLVDFMKSKNANCLISLPAYARFWIFTDVDTLIEYVSNGNILDVKHCYAFVK